MRSGNYEIDEDGNLVEVGTGNATVSSPVTTVGEEKEGPTPGEVLFRIYGLFQFIVAAGLFWAISWYPQNALVMVLIFLGFYTVSHMLRKPLRQALVGDEDEKKKKASQAKSKSKSKQRRHK